MTDGYIYCFSNGSMPGILKIGMTERTPDVRLKESNSSNTWKPPTLYKIEFAKKVFNPKQKETILHTLLAKYTERINPKREFFRVSLEEVKTFFDIIDGELWIENIDKKEEEDILIEQGIDVNIFKQKTVEYKDDILKITVEYKDDILQFKLDNFDIENPKYKKINDILKIPVKIINENKDIKMIFIDTYKLIKHFYISNYMFKEDTILLKKIINKVGDFELNKIQISYNKIIYLKQLKTHCKDINFNSINSKPLKINKIENEAMSKYFKLIFRTEKKDIDFNNINDCNKIQNHIYKNLFGDISKSIQIRENGAKINKYTIDEDIIKFNEYIYNFRKSNINFIDEITPELVCSKESEKKYNFYMINIKEYNDDIVKKMIVDF